ncbi:MAG: sigma 54-interacting transcriptional regulator [Myxococcales bacterium]|nr:sigma 54-interacting transcriptional regulator [Myxococcales bacterium]
MSIEKARSASETAKNTVIDASDDRKSDVRVLYILGDSPQSIALSEGRTLIVGRSNASDIVVDAPSVSRSHLAIHVGRTIQLEDLNSANKTTVNGSPIEPGRRVDVVAGEEFSVGKVPCVIHGRTRIVPRVDRAVRSHEYFEARLADECDRVALDRSQRFAVARVRVEAIVDRTIEAAIAGALGGGDVIARYAPHEFELFFARGEDHDDKLAAIGAALTALGVRWRSVYAVCPQHGRTSDLLIERLNAELAAPTKLAPELESSLIVEDPAMRALYALVDRVARSDVSVLLLGEMGTGKEVVAREIHRRSKRSGKPYCAVNCASFTESLAEAELFGYERGAFTGANAARAGIIEAAAGGTVFFDEVGELAPSVQAKLLRVLEERKVRRVGSTEERPIDVRFIAATNRDLDAAVERAEFRGDLYFRLEGFTLHVPPLRERTGEVGPLAERFLVMAAKAADRAPPSLSRAARGVLERHRWPGNVRELRNEMTRALILADGAVILPEHLSVARHVAARGAQPASIAPSSPEPSAPASGSDETSVLRTLAEVKADAERDHVRRVLEHCQHNQTRAAEVLGISRSQIVNLIERYHLPRPRGRG